MQYTPHYNLNLPEGTDIVNPLIQDNPNYTAIDTALYNNKLRVIGTATHTKTGTNHSVVLADSDITAFKFVATGDYASGDTFSVDGVTVTARIADGSSIPSGAFKINNTVVAILDGTILNLINVEGIKSAATITYDNSGSGLAATTVQGAIDEITIKQSVSVVGDGVKTYKDLFNNLYSIADLTKIGMSSYITSNVQGYARFMTVVGWPDVSGGYAFSRTVGHSTDTEIANFVLHPTNGTFTRVVNGTIIDVSSYIASAGETFELVY